MPTIEILPVGVPYLEPDGTNWAIFSMRFRDAMKAMHRWAYFAGHKPCPKPKDTGKPTDAEVDAAEKWEYKDSMATHLLFQRLPNSIVMRLSRCCTAHEQWEAITREYQAKSAFAQAD